MRLAEHDRRVVQRLANHVETAAALNGGWQRDLLGDFRPAMEPEPHVIAWAELARRLCAHALKASPPASASGPCCATRQRGVPGQGRDQTPSVTTAPSEARGGRNAGFTSFSNKGEIPGSGRHG